MFDELDDRQVEAAEAFPGPGDRGQFGAELTLHVVDEVLFQVLGQNGGVPDFAQGRFEDVGCRVADLAAAGLFSGLLCGFLGWHFWFLLADRIRRWIDNVNHMSGEKKTAVEVRESTESVRDAGIQQRWRAAPRTLPTLKRALNL